MHDKMVSSIMRLNEMEQSMEDMLEYNDAVTCILNGSTPASQSTAILDGTRYDKSTVERNEADSLLRVKMESEDSDYALSNTKRPRYEAPIFSAPIDGVVSRPFNDPLSNGDIILTPLGSDMTVMAVEQGTIVGISNQTDGTVVVTMQHSGGYVSVYGNLSELLVRRGNRVSSGSAIGRVGSISNETVNHSAELKFELWRDGALLDPEPYISISK
jgi:murein DD-endopeptidase MepM/ murein hydrolase activator NlpD